MNARSICGGIYDRPEDDSTDAAHPAWWRGEKHGSERTAEKLLKVARLGRGGAHFTGPMEEAAETIVHLRDCVDKMAAACTASEARVATLEKRELAKGAKP